MITLEVHPRTNLNIRHTYGGLEIEIEDADYKLTQNILTSVFEQEGMQTLSEILTIEDLTQLFLDRRDDFEEIIRKYKD